MEKINKEEFDKMAHVLAYQFADSVLSSEGITMRDADGEAWEMVDTEGDPWCCSHTWRFSSGQIFVLPKPVVARPASTRGS